MPLSFASANPMKPATKTTKAPRSCLGVRDMGEEARVTFRRDARSGAFRRAGPRARREVEAQGAEALHRGVSRDLALVDADEGPAEARRGGERRAAARIGIEDDVSRIRERLDEPREERLRLLGGVARA